MNKLFLNTFLAIIALFVFSCSADKTSKTQLFDSKNLLKNNTKTGKKIIVAVIDTGVDINHEDIKDHLWISKDGKSNGWNFVDNNSVLTDNIGHGTHIAGIIASASPNVSLMILKYYDSDSVSHKKAFDNSLKALRYAIDNKADIINYSGGGSGSSIEELELLKEAESKGIIVVSAAGNESKDIDINPYYPASYKLSNIITVASLGADGKLLQESNYGYNTVDIAAPGEDVLSALPGNRHGYLTGTSQATAFITSIVASIKLSKKTYDVKSIKKLISNYDKTWDHTKGKLVINSSTVSNI